MVTTIFDPSVGARDHPPPPWRSRPLQATLQPSKFGSRGAQRRRPPPPLRAGALEEESVSTLGMHDFTQTARSDDAVAAAGFEASAHETGDNHHHLRVPDRVVVKIISRDFVNEVTDNTGIQPHDGHMDDDHPHGGRMTQSKKMHNTKSKKGDQKSRKKKGHSRRRDFRRAPHLQEALNRIQERKERNDPSSPRLQSAMDRILHIDEMQQLNMRRKRNSRRRPHPQNDNYGDVSTNDRSRRRVQQEGNEEMMEFEGRQRHISRVGNRPVGRRRSSKSKTVDGEAPFTARLFEGTNIEAIESDEWGAPIGQQGLASPSREQSASVQNTNTRQLNLSPKATENNEKVATVVRGVRKRQLKRIERELKIRTQLHQNDHQQPQEQQRQQQRHQQLLGNKQLSDRLECAKAVNQDEELIPLNWRKEEPLTYPKTDIHGSNTRVMLAYEERSNRIRKLQKELAQLRNQSRERQRSRSPPRLQSHANSNRLDQARSTRLPTLTGTKKQAISHLKSPNQVVGGRYGDSSEASLQPSLGRHSESDTDEPRATARLSHAGTLEKSQLLVKSGRIHTEEEGEESMFDQSDVPSSDDGTTEWNDDEDDNNLSEESQDDYGRDVTYALNPFSNALSKLMPDSGTSQRTGDNRSTILSRLLPESPKKYQLLPPVLDEQHDKCSGGPFPPEDHGGSNFSEHQKRQWGQHETIDHDELDESSSSSQEDFRGHFLPVSPVKKEYIMPVFDQLDEARSSNSESGGGSGEVSWKGRKTGRNSPTPSEQARALIQDVERVQSFSQSIQFKQERIQEQIIGVKERFHGSFDAMEMRMERNRILTKRRLLELAAEQQRVKREAEKQHYDGGNSYVRIQKVESKDGVAYVVAKEKYLQPGAGPATQQHAAAISQNVSGDETEIDLHSTGTDNSEDVDRADDKWRQDQQRHFLPLSPSYKSQHSTSTAEIVVDVGSFIEANRGSRSDEINDGNYDDGRDDSFDDGEMMQRFSISLDGYDAMMTGGYGRQTDHDGQSDHHSVTSSEVSTPRQPRVPTLPTKGPEKHDEQEDTMVDDDAISVPARTELRRVPRSLLSTGSSITSINSKDTLGRAIDPVIALSLLEDDDDNDNLDPEERDALDNYDETAQDDTANTIDDSLRAQATYSVLEYDMPQKKKGGAFTTQKGRRKRQSTETTSPSKTTLSPPRGTAIVRKNDNDHTTGKGECCKETPVCSFPGGWATT